MLRDNVFDKRIALCCGNRHHKRTCLDLIRDYRILCAVESVHALDLDNVSTGAHYICAHGVEEVREIDNVRFLGGVFKYGKTLRLDSGEHSVYGSSYGDFVEIDLRSEKEISLDINDTVYYRAFCSEGTEAFQMLIHRSVTEIAPARHRNLSVSESAEQRSKEIVRSSHGTRKLVRHRHIPDRSRVYFERILIDESDLRAELAQDTKIYRNIVYGRNIFEHAGPVGKDNSRYDRDCGILCTAYLYFTRKSVSAVYYKFLQNINLLFGILDTRAAAVPAVTECPMNLKRPLRGTR